ncbi:MAG: ATP-dependent DNA helicase RecG [Acidobacteriota bacterium]
MSLDRELRALRGVGPRRAADLQKAGLTTVGDLVARFPTRYEDRARFRDLATLRAGDEATIDGSVVSCGIHLTRRRGFRIFDALVRTRDGSIRAVWLNQPFMADVIRRGARVVLHGRAEVHERGGLQLTNPQYEIVADEDGTSLHTGRTVPVYEKTGTLTARMQRTLVHDALALVASDVPALLPAWVESELGLPPFARALRESHFPDPAADLDTLNRFRTPAQVRVILEEFFHFQLGLLLRRRAADAERKPRPVVVDDRVRAAARAVLPFRLTAGQRAAVKSIVADMTRPQPMHRLLQGDVGSGKTIVAVLAAVVAMENRLQVAFMVPTEVLADQHLLLLRRLLEPAGYRVGLLSGSLPAAERREILDGLRTGRIRFVVGTQALVQADVEFADLGLAVIDEQHRFGVIQRAVLREKGWRPDVLVMTATPIPRTLALTVYGDLDVSVIGDRPPGRQRVTTRSVPESARDDVYRHIRSQVDGGHQAYIVYPLVEESCKVDVRAASRMADHLAQEVFPDLRLALLHGRLTGEQKDRIMQAFAAGLIDVLVSTSVIEVGIDVPNATAIVIEHAERFGLAQLHQLRGRVGRGPAPSSCVLVYQEPLTEAARARLDALVHTEDGFVIAERDLEQRGPGDVFGTRQSGAPALRSGDLKRDHDLMEDARRYALAELDCRAGGDDDRWGQMRAAWASRFGLSAIG